jgi:Haem-binding domain/Cytochrome P460
MKKFLHKQWVWMGVIFLFILIGIQFIRPPQDAPPVTSVIQLPDSAQQVLVKSCFDCHTSMTKYSWFDRIAPASWVVRDHVREGRKLVNFSQWDSLSKDEQKVLLFESLNQMQFRTMPLEQYAFIHPSSKLGAGDIRLFQTYLKTLISPYLPDSVKIKRWKEQYASWRSGFSNNQKIAPSLNGIVFDPNYKNWVAISSTERFDNGTMRVIVGNEIAIKAVRAHHTNPWPNGSVLVKILWISMVDSSGNLQSGAFRQADFMIRDQKKYSDTEGWGFARWTNGLQLTPYGKNELFASECVNCHRSMKSNDFVFTDPIDMDIESGMEENVISSSIRRDDGTMSTIYGNQIAVHFARTQAMGQYPEGSRLNMVTWKQKEDDHWFGARIPGTVQMFETIFMSDSGGKLYPLYERKDMNSTGTFAAPVTADAKRRTNYILGQRPSIMP